jgi:uncharacterized membrane protein
VAQAIFNLRAARRFLYYKGFMKASKGSLLFALFVVCAGAFVWLTSARLPMLVASHFGGSGTANGFLPRDAYVCFMLGLVVVLPAVMVFLTWLAIASPPTRINLPDKDYWLAPQRRDQTMDHLRSGIGCFSIMLVVFLCYVHWLVVLANAAQPARLDNFWFVGGLLIFFVFLIIWLKKFLGYFRQSA